MKVVGCVVCGILFDLYNARWCSGYHGPEPGREGRCKVCPMGHALHDLDDWQKLPRREPSEEERAHGFSWILEGVGE